MMMMMKLRKRESSRKGEMKALRDVKLSCNRSCSRSVAFETRHGIAMLKSEEEFVKRDL